MTCICKLPWERLGSKAATTGSRKSQVQAPMLSQQDLGTVGPQAGLEKITVCLRFPFATAHWRRKRGVLPDTCLQSGADNPVQVKGAWDSQTPPSNSAEHLEATLQRTSTLGGHRLLRPLYVQFLVCLCCQKSG